MNDDAGTIGALLRERYGEAAAALPAAMALPELFLSHRSVRAFAKTALPAGTVETLVAAAQSASTSSNLQTWSVVAVTDQAMKDELSRLSGDQAYVRDAPLQMVWLADLSRLRDAATAQGLPAEGTDYLELFMVAVIDAALASQNAALAAEAMGLGIVYIGAMRNNPTQVAELLHLPQRCFAAFGMCVGWPDGDRPAAIKPRLSQQAVLHRETYDGTPVAEAVRAYDEESMRFSGAQKMDRPAWSIHSGNRVRGPESLNGRHTMRQSLSELGFPLK